MAASPPSLDNTVSLPPGGANAIKAASTEVAWDERQQFYKDVADLLRGQLNPDLDDVVQCIALAKDLARRRHAR